MGNAVDAELIPVPRPGQLMLPGPVDASNGDTLLTGSLLYGVRPWRANNPVDQQFLQRYTDLYNLNSIGRSTLDDTRMRRFREELTETITQPTGGAIYPVLRKSNPAQQPQCIGTASYST